MNEKAKKRKMDENKEKKNNKDEEAVKKEKKLKEEQIKEFLVCACEMRLFKPDKMYSDRQYDYCTKKVDDAFPISSTCFPSIIKIHTTGSRAEKLWSSQSDTDILYEIGPDLVYQKNQVVETTVDQNRKHSETLVESKSASGGGCFFWEETEHVGHYRVYDSKGGGYLYPKDLQMKLAPTLQYLQNNKIGTTRVDNEETNQAALMFSNEYMKYTQLGKGNDHVIGLKLDKWPDSIKDQLIHKLGAHVVEQLIGKK